MIRTLLTLLIVLVSATATAQTATTSVTLSWTAPTKNTDGSALAGALSYNLYEATSATGPWTKVQGQLSAVSEQLSTITAGNCFAVTAVVAGTESAMSTVACIRQPSAPTGLTSSVILILKSP